LITFLAEPAGTTARLPVDTFVIASALVRPESRGSVQLASSNWQDPLIINGNYLGTDRDLDAIVRGTELAHELGSQNAFDGMRTREVVPGPSATRSEIRELAQLAADHASNSCSCVSKTGIRS
jgi:choline dehydrogenase-like flavoprotein